MQINSRELVYFFFIKLSFILVYLLNHEIAFGGISNVFA